jgi:hypothetical protein
MKKQANDKQTKIEALTAQAEKFLSELRAMRPGKKSAARRRAVQQQLGAIGDELRALMS